jgi:hypothetical protein
MARKDPEAKKQYYREWYERNKEREKQRARDHYAQRKATGHPSYTSKATAICPSCASERTIKLGGGEHRIARDEQGRIPRKCRSCANMKSPPVPVHRPEDAGKSRYEQVRIASILYKGGRCENCSYQFDYENSFAFDLHHLDPSKKDFQFNQIGTRRWDRITEELDKCSLLCAICHRRAHNAAGLSS